MTDIFKDWKCNRFIIAGPDLTGGTEFLIVLTEIKFWMDHEQELIQWCEDNNAATQGMTVVTPDEKTLTAFVLKWR